MLLNVHSMLQRNRYTAQVSHTFKDCVALTWPAADGGQGRPEVQATPAATVNHVWNARF